MIGSGSDGAGTRNPVAAQLHVHIQLSERQISRGTFDKRASKL
jgi:hypothetical protein